MRAAGLRLLLVRGLDVQLRPLGGTLSPDDLPGVRAQLGHHDVTELLTAGIRLLADPADEPDEARRPLLSTPAPAALVDQAAEGLAGTRAWVAPGATADLSGAASWAARLPGLDLRVAALPVLGPGDPDPDLLTPLAQRFPGELVVLVRGTWLEATGPAPAEIESARSAVLGRFDRVLGERAVAPENVITRFVERFALLHEGIAFRRPQVRQVTARQLFGRWAPRVGLALALLVAGGALLRALRSVARQRREAAAAYRRDVAGVLATTARLGADLLRAPPHSAVAAQAAERYDTARTLLAQAHAGRDADVLAVAAEAADQGRRLLADSAR